MSARVFWIDAVRPHRLAMMPRPRIEEIEDLKAEGLDTVVCLLDPYEILELELQDEKTVCESLGMEYIGYPIRDRGLPSSYRETDALIARLVERLKAGKAVGVHCRVGIGRSGLISGCILHRLGIPFPEIFSSLSKSRGAAVPDTSEQAHWVRIYSLGEDFPAD